MLLLVNSESSAEQMRPSKQLELKATFRRTGFQSYIEIEQLGLHCRIHKVLKTCRMHSIH